MSADGIGSGEHASMRDLPANPQGANPIPADNAVAPACSSTAAGSGNPPWLEHRGTPWLILGGGLVLTALALPVDGIVARAAQRVHLGGDFRREFEAWQQYGQFTCSVLVALVVWVMDPGRRRRLADLAVAWLITCAAVVLSKGLIGRPRPRLDDPYYFLGPLGQYPLGPEVGIRHAWEVWAGVSSDLWSMPSSHAAYAAVLSLFLAAMYARLTPLVLSLAAFVGIARVLTGAHYPSDVIVGWTIGSMAAREAMVRQWGRRVLILRRQA